MLPTLQSSEQTQLGSFLRLRLFVKPNLDINFVFFDHLFAT